MEEQVFNAEDTGLFYKNVGKWTYAMQMASKPSGFKSCKDPCNLAIACQCQGDFKCKQIMVHRAQNPIALREEKPEPYASPHWRWNKKAWMESGIFWNWFHNCFISEAECYLHGKTLPSGFCSFWIMFQSIIT